MNTENRPLPAYRGYEPYFYVNFDYKDSDMVYPEIKRFQDMGYNIFYDESIKHSNNISDETSKRIDDCSLFVIFVTENSVLSEKVKDEFRYAITEDKPMLAIYFDDFESIWMSSLWRYELLDIKPISKNSLLEESYVSQLNEVFQNALDGSDEETETVAYESDEPYIFVSYDNSDGESVLKEIRRLHNMGCNVRFNEYAGSSDEEVKDTLKLIDGCRLLVSFVTKKSTSSYETTREAEYAIDNNIPILPIYLEDLEGSDLEFDYGLFNPIFKNSLRERDYVSLLSQNLQDLEIIPKDPTNSRLVPGVGREPLQAYRGKNPYAFVSYAHKDSYRVFPDIKQFMDMDYNVWYDEGIAPASEWLANVLRHLDECVLFIIFITKKSIASVNVKKEIKYARYLGKPILPIFLEDFSELDMDSEWGSILKPIQGIIKPNMVDEEYIFKVTEVFAEYGFEQNIENILNPEDVLLDDSLKNDVLYSDIHSNDITAFLDDFFDDLVMIDDYSNGHNFKEILRSSIDVFLENKTLFNAYEIYKTFFGIYQILPLDVSMGDFEELYQEKDIILKLIDVIVRYSKSDQLNEVFIHSVNVFIFGLVFYSQNERYRSLFKAYVLKSPYEKFYRGTYSLVSDEEFLYRWGIASLMHDICLPLENIGELLNKRLFKEFDSILGKTKVINNFKDLNEIYKLQYYFKDEFSSHYPETNFLDLFKPTDIMAHKIYLDFEGFSLPMISNSLSDYVDLMMESEFSEHGLFAAFLVLDSYGYLIQEYEKSTSFFFYPVVDSATAILLHNYYRYFLQSKPFNLKQLHPQDSPLAYLLILCDSILEFYKKPENVIDDNVNEIANLQFGMDKFDAEYIVKSAAYGFAFSNELYLDELLDISALFDDDLSIQLDLSNLNGRDSFRFDERSYNYVMENVEKFAILMYQNQVDEITERYNEKLSDGTLDNETKYKFEKLNDFEGLPAELKIEYFRQAKTVPKQLDIIGCEIADKSDVREPILEFSQDDVNDLACYEHQKWCENKIGQGWTYAEVTNYSKLTSKYLVPWNELPAEIQQSGIDFAKTIPKLIDDIGFKIVLSRWALLTFKIYCFSEDCSSYDSSLLFESLPHDIKEINLKKTDLIVEALSKLDYNVVDASDSGGKITSFKDDEMRYFARYVHDEWCNLIRSLGWKFGEIQDISKKTNPNLRSWQQVSQKYASKQVDIFKILPKFCDEVELKIVRDNFE